MSVQRRKPARRSGQSKGVAFYDLDGTLVDINLVHAALFALSNLGEWSARIGYLASFIARIPALIAAERRDRRLLNSVLFEVFRGISEDRLAMLGDEYCDRVLLKRFYPQAAELLEANRAAGLEPILVTGSPNFIVAPLARRLGVRTVAANSLIFRGGRATGRLREPIMAGNEKAAWCASYAGEQGIRLADCWGYADSYYDLPFLAALGHPVAVNPDRKLAAAAQDRQWPILRFAPSTARRSILPALAELDEA